MVATLNLREFGLQQVVSRYRGNPLILQAALNDTLRSIGRLLVPLLKKNTPLGASHHLRNYTTFEVFKLPLGQRLEVRQPARSDQGFFYGAAVRHGTRPHHPPVTPLIPWVMAKWGLSGPGAVSGAWRLAKTIEKRGTRTNPYDERTLTESRPGIRLIIQQLAARLKQEV